MQIPDSLLTRSEVKARATAMPTCQHPTGVPTYTRTYACWTGTFATIVTGTEPWTLITNGAYEEWLQADSRTWERVVYVQPTLAQGGWDPSPARMNITHGCTNPGCPDMSTQKYTFSPIQLNTVYSHEFYMTSGGTATVYPNPQSFFDVTLPLLPSTGKKADFGAPTGIQCDSDPDIASTSKPGCVYYWYTPTYVVDYKGAMPTIAGNILYGQLALRTRPGFPGTDTQPGGQYLVRGPKTIADPKTGEPADFSELSRRVACPKSIPRPPNETCDEYPFASTWQGAEWVPATEWTCRFVPSSENDIQGGDINTFFDKNRLQRNATGKAADPSHSRPLGAFWVWVSNAPSSPPSFKQCQNHM
jgi:Deoxyribonuclease NucA/NucB